MNVFKYSDLLLIKIVLFTAELRPKIFSHFSILGRDLRPFNFQNVVRNRGTVEEHFGFYLGLVELNPAIFMDGRTDRQNYGQT